MTSATKPASMGCINCKTDINDRHPNIFQVVNVNEQGNPLSPGKLQVTDSELVFYQKRKGPTRWPLRSLRKYGCDIEVFSFECGRRCPTGQGIYAFRCKKAEQLFNIVQQHIAGNVNPPNDESIANGDFTIPLIQRRSATESGPGGYLNPTQRVVPTLSRPGSITSNGPLSPTVATSPTVTSDMPIEHNNNKRASLVPAEHAYTNTSALELPMNYVNLPAENYVNVAANHCHVYMNVDDPDEVQHCYANVVTKELDLLRPKVESVPQTPTALVESGDGADYITVREVNYIELDLENAKMAAAEAVVPTVPESPTTKSYATIDFQKTNALCQSVNPRMETEEGSRKTRHNSTIHYNNSLSD